MENTKIEWCDMTFNPWEGCAKVSPGCANCYAEARNARWHGGAAPNWGKGAPRRKTSDANWKMPLRWNEAAGMGRFVQCLGCGARETRKLRNGWLDACGSCGLPAENGGMIPARPRVFCASLADWLDDEVPIEWLADLLDLIRRTTNLDWLLLTKRPGNWRLRLAAAAIYANENLNPELEDWIESWVAHRNPPANVWIGASVEDQQRADERIPELLKIPARVRFLSCEPLLGPVSIDSTVFCDLCFGQAEPMSLSDGTPWCGNCDREMCGYVLDPILDNGPGIHWVIAGGESGSKARPMHPDWARSLRDQCQAAGVPFFFKQWGEWLPGEKTPASGHGYASCADGGPLVRCGHTAKSRQNFGTHADRFSGSMATIRVGKKAAGRMLDGREWSEFPR